MKITFKLFILAFALVLGLTQCKKKDVETTTTGDLGEAVYITVNVGDGDRHIVYPGTGAVVYTDGDVIYVGNNGKYIGTLTYADGAFSGTIYGPSTEDYLHFYFVGGLTPSATPEAGTTTDFTVSIADQSTQLPVLSYGRSTVKYTDASTTYGCTLLNKCGLVKFVPEEATPETVTVGGMKTTAIIDFANSGIAPTAATGNVTLYAENDATKWAVLLPQDEVSDLKGTIGIFSCTVTNMPEVSENLYYSKGVDMAVRPGVLGGVFTINTDGDQVNFSQGNLQYIGSAATPYWKFAEHQYDYLGTTTGQNSDAANVDRDLFGWGTSGISGYSPIANSYEPWSTINSSPQYNPYGSVYTNLYDGGDNAGKADWGYNAIANGGDTPNSGWRTLTRAEWIYVFLESARGENRFLKANITVGSNSYNGIILFPDGYDGSIGSYTYNDDKSGWIPVSADDWIAMETRAGAVFFPAAGMRISNNVSNVNAVGSYWSSSRHSNDNSICAFLTSSFFYPYYNNSKYMGFSVRLVI